MANLTPAVYEPVDVVKGDGILIKEFCGNVASQDPRLSACVVEISKASEEAWQIPEFDEWVIVLEGKVHLLHGKDGSRLTVLSEGQGALLPAGFRVKWVWPGPCKYVPICTPAFSPSNCKREEEEGAAKSEQDMERLKELHKKNKNLYHAALKSDWEKAAASGSTYYPPTYKQEGFIHASDNLDRLVGILNMFCKDQKGEFVCLRFTEESLTSSKAVVKWEPGSPEAKDILFPHIYENGISPSSVIETLSVQRDGSGAFLGFSEGPPLTLQSQPAPSGATSLASAFVAGVCIGFLLCRLK